jgi:hypothetical protein
MTTHRVRTFISPLRMICGVVVSMTIGLSVIPRLTAQVASDSAEMVMILADNDWIPKINLQWWVSWDLTKIHPGTAHDPQRLGDINDDGYDDFAFRSITDTIFVYLGDTLVGPVPYLLLPGGGKGLTSGDFNGDGYIDIAASVDSMPNEQKRFGRIFIYLHHRGKPEYGPAPDFVLVGDSTYWGWGVRGYPSMTTGDFNGDGIDDLAFHTSGPYDPVARKSGGVVLVNGATDFRAEVSEIFWEHEDPWNGPDGGLWSADITGDDRDELVSYGTNRGVSPVLFIYAGTAEEPLGARYESVIRPDLDPICLSPSTVDGIQFSDVNNDGYADIIGWDGPGPNYPERSIIWGASTLPERFVKDTLYPNPDPKKKYLIGCYGVYPVGDIDGDGTRDYSVAYTTGPNDIWTNYMYSGRAGWKSKAIAYYGMDQFWDSVHGEPHDIGDVNGDGYDDIFHGGYGSGLGFRIIKGRNMNLTAVEEIPVAYSPELLIYPNPVRSGGSARIVVGEGIEGELVIIDALGRCVLTRRMYGAASFPTTALPAGMYFLRFRTGVASRFAKLLIQ